MQRKMDLGRTAESPVMSNFNGDSGFYDVPPGALRKLLSQRRSFFMTVAATGGLIGFLKAFRLPYTWAATQAQFDYRYGLVRRGLFGAACQALRLPIHDYRLFSAISLALLFVFLGLFLRFLASSRFWRVADGAFAALALSSFGLSYMINLVGYLDILLGCFVLLVLSIRRHMAAAVVATIAGILGVLIHEMYLIALLPISLTALVLTIDHGTRSHRLRGLLTLAPAVVLPAVLVAYLVSRPAPTSQQIDDLRASVHAASNFPVMDKAFEVLTRPTRQSLADLNGQMRSGIWWTEQAFQSLAFLPTAFFFLCVSYRLLPKDRSFTRIYLVPATLSPLLLYFLGFDFSRWMALCTLNAIYGAITIYRCLPRPEGRACADTEAARPHAFGIVAQRIAVLLILVNVSTNTGMFEGNTKNFPFPQYAVDLRGRFKHGTLLLGYEP